MFLGADYDRVRPDVGAMLGASYTKTGYQITVRGLAPGRYTIVAYGHSTRTGAFTIARAVPLTIAPSARLVVDQPRAGTLLQQPFTIAGWAFDGAAQTGTGIDAIHVWAFPNAAAGGPNPQPVFLGAATLDDLRPDVAAYFGAQFASSGYHLTVNTLSRNPGAAYDIVVYAHAVQTGTFSVAQLVPVQMVPATPMLFIDAPRANTTVGTTFDVAGWAVEVNGASGTGIEVVHVWATSTTGTTTFLGQAAYGIVRPDVGAYLGARYAASGFSLTGSLPPGDYFVSVYARSTTTDKFSAVRVVFVHVQ